MVRRVGFGNTQLPEDIGETPDDETLPSTYSRLRREEAAPAPKGLSARLFGASFLGIWLIGWTIAIRFSAVTFIRANDIETRIFLGIWIAFALLGWWFAVRTFMRLLRGKKP